MGMLDYLKDKLDGIIDDVEEVVDDIKESIEARFEDIQDYAEELIEEIKQDVLENPEPIFSLLRRFKPILLVKNYALVTRFDDVQEIFARNNIFHQIYKPHMENINQGENYILGMQDTPIYTRDKTNIWQVIPRQDIPTRILPF